MSVKTEMAVIKALCVAIINKALVETGKPVRHDSKVRDDVISIIAHPDGRIEMADIEDGPYPADFRLEELTLAELANLTSVAAAMLGEPELLPGPQYAQKEN